MVASTARSPELRPIIAKFRNDHSRVTLDGPRLSAQEERVLAGQGGSGPEVAMR